MGRGRRLLVVAVGSVLAGTIAAPMAMGQAVYPATVTTVIDGDSLRARTVDGVEVSVRLVGVDAPERDECGGEDATAVLVGLVEGREVELKSDPSVAVLDEFGRSRFYVDRVDGLDAGLELVRRGWAAVVGDPAFQRLSSYLDAEAASEQGVWQECGGDFHLTHAEQLRALGFEAREFVRRYYRRLSNDRYRTAWRMLGRPIKRQLGYNFRNWRSSYRGSLGISVRATRSRVSGERLVVAVALRSRDRDVCSGRAVAQRFRGSVFLAQRGDSFAIVRFRVHRTSGAKPRLAKSQCPKPKPRPAPSPPSVDCQGYSPCLAPGPDVDCAGGSGNGPRYIQGPVSVGGSDPYDLDRDGDGIACES